MITRTEQRQSMRRATMARLAAEDAAIAAYEDRAAARYARIAAERQARNNPAEVAAYIAAIDAALGRKGY